MRITTTIAVAIASFRILTSSWGTVLAWTTLPPPTQPRSLPSSSSTALASASASASASSSSRRSFIEQAAMLIVPPVTTFVAASPAFAADGDDNPATTSWPDPVVATALAQDDRTTAEPVVAAALATPEEAEPAPATAPVVPEPAPATAPAPAPAPAPATTAIEAENPFIARLKQQSDAKAGQYKKDAQRSDKLSKQMFRDQYNRPTYYGIRTKNSTGGAADAIMVLGPELQELLKSGKVTQSYESKMNKKSGEISDDYSKPIYVFTD